MSRDFCNVKAQAKVVKNVFSVSVRAVYWLLDKAPHPYRVCIPYYKIRHNVAFWTVLFKLI